MTEKERITIIDLKEKGFSFGEIAKQLNLAKSTVSTFYKNYLESKGKCKYCGTPLKKTRNVIKSFCSDKCRNKWWNEHKAEINHRKTYTFVCNCCGQEFKRIQNKRYKYCSYRCFNQNRGGHHEGQ